MSQGMLFSDETLDAVETTNSEVVEEPQLNLRELLAERKTELAAEYTELVRHGFKQLVEKYGPTLKGVYNSCDAHFFASAIRRVLTHPLVDGKVSYMPNQVYIMDEERLVKAAEYYAESAVNAWALKLQEKVGDLENVKVTYQRGCSYLITGTRSGRQVRIEQHMILNVSRKGTPYNQFPARIYVDGKFTSAKKYKELFAAVEK